MATVAEAGGATSAQRPAWMTAEQYDNALTIYREARAAGLPVKRAIEMVVAAYHESGLRADAVNSSSGAAGLFQLLSAGYRKAAERLGGLFDPVANTRAILPSYVSYWRKHPTAPIGAGGRDIERSGQPASWYAAGYDRFTFLTDGAAASSSAGAEPPKLGDWLTVSGADVEKTSPSLLARVWLLGAWLGKKITIESGYRSDEEQTRIWDSGVRPAARPVARGGGGSNHTRGQAVDAFIGGQGVGDVVDEKTLARFGLKSLKSIDDPQHLEEQRREAFNPNRAEALGAALPIAIWRVGPKLGPRIWGALKGTLKVGGKVVKKAPKTAVGVGVWAGLAAAFGGDFKQAALWLLLLIGGLALVLLGVLRLVGLRPGTVVNVALAREVGQ